MGQGLQVIRSYPLTSELMDPPVRRVGVHRDLVPAYSVPRNSKERGSAQGLPSVQPIRSVYTCYTVV